MALTVLRVPIVFTISFFEFYLSNCRDFIANDKWRPIHPISIHWIIRVGSNAGVLSQAATEANNSSWV